MFNLIALSFAIKTIPLSVAYASWGALGIIGTITREYFFWLLEHFF
ncbi:SMR family transporter [Helicobacter anatolicus]